MIIDMSQFNRDKEARERAVQQVAAGKALTLKAFSSDLQGTLDPFKNLPGRLHILTPQQLYDLQQDSSPFQKESALSRSLRENPEAWANATEAAVQVADEIKDAVRDAAVHALQTCHPQCANALSAAFKLFKAVEFIALIKIEDTTVAAIVADRMMRHFLLRPSVKGNEVEIHIQPHASSSNWPLAQASNVL